ncbi:hypothetical protein [Calidifontibacter terrae]
MRHRILAGTAAALALAIPTVGAAHAAPNGQSTYTFAVIGDVPYGADQVAKFPAWIQQINGDRDLHFTTHLGDIKNGSTVCSNDYFNLIKADVDTFAKPFIYTVGDNEWTDCHRPNNGAYNPLERLSTIRSTFFAQPNQSLGGKPMKLQSQAAQGSPENHAWRAGGVSFAALNIVGSNNGLQPWTGNTTATPEQVSAEQLRMGNAISLLRSTFADAKKRNDRAVSVMIQADMFDPTYTPTPEDISAFTPFVQALVKESNAYDGQVYLFNGDSHIYNSDHPLAAGSPWLERYSVTTPVTNLERVTVDGSNNNKDWLRVTINKPTARDVLSWTRVPYAF